MSWNMEAKMNNGCWKPIKTAPKDSTVIDIWDGERGERLADYFREDRGDGNIFYSPAKGGPCCIRTATHWMKVSPPLCNAEPELPGDMPVEIAQ